MMHGFYLDGYDKVSQLRGKSLKKGQKPAKSNIEPKDGSWARKSRASCSCA